MTAVAPPRRGRVELYWIPLGAGARSVRINGIVYEAVAAALQRRRRCDLYHSVLGIEMPSGRYLAEMTPVPPSPGAKRGIVAAGPVGLRAAGRFRLFRYEVRRWRDGIVPDISYAVDSPVQISDELACAQAVFDLLPWVPTPTWGRDELETGEMWSCNSITSWVLTTAGVDVDAIPFPERSRAPGWDAGIAVARRCPPTAATVLPPARTPTGALPAMAGGVPA